MDGYGWQRRLDSKFMKPNLKSLRAYTMLATRTHPMSRYVDEMDRKVLRRRIDAEGVPFLCILLPSLGKALEQSLQSGVWDTPVGFKNRPGERRPCLFWKAFAEIFTADGNLRTDVDVKQVAEAVLAVRQLTLAHGKCDWGSCEASHIEAAWSSFKVNQERIRNVEIGQVFGSDCIFTNAYGNSVPMSLVMRKAKQFVYSVFGGFSTAEIVPRHGAGVAANRYLTPQRYDLLTHVYKPSLDKVMPYSDYLFSGGGALCDQYRLLDRLPVVHEFHDIAAFVPKDVTKVRGISKIHSTPMFFGQAIAEWMKDAMKSPRLKGEIDITDQDRNKRLACSGSTDGRLATIDLSDASDSLKWELVAYLMPVPVWDVLREVRAIGTSYKGDAVEYACFAPMGSPVCFPVQTIVFWALTRAATYYYYNGSRKATVHSVYGDDIICNTDCYDAVTSVLTALGLKVNHGKSFSRGLFRESCGGDYYAGCDVSIVRCKKPPVPKSLTSDVLENVFRYTDLYGRHICRYKIHQCEEPYRSIVNHVRSNSITAVPVVVCDTPTALERLSNANALPALDGTTDLQWLTVRKDADLQVRYITLLSQRPLTATVALRGARVKPGKPCIRIRSGWSYMLRALTSVRQTEHDNRCYSGNGHSLTVTPSVTTWTLRDSNVLTTRHLIL
jgi:hypothetical protein